MDSQHGFTLIELVVVLSIIAILATFAASRFIDMSGSSKQAATNGVAASLTAASSSNYALRTANSASGSAIANCTSIGPLLQGGLPAGYSITSAAITNGATVTCTLTGQSSTTATFVGRGIT